MRIAIMAPLVTAICEPQRGGSQAFVSDLARGLVRRGHDVHVYAASGSQIRGVEVIDTGVDPQSLAATLYRAGEPVPDAAGPADAAFGAAYAMMSENRYDVIHNHAFDAPAIRLAAGLSAPVVHTLHLPPDEAVAAEVGRAVRGDSPPSIATVSVFQANAWQRVAGIDAILPPYVPTSEMPWSLSPGSGAVFAGRLSPEKGAADAIEIACAAGIPIDVYGDSYNEEYTRAEIEPRGSRPGVAVHPALPREAVWLVMSRAAVVLCPSRWDEPFGMAAAEAQAAGTPVVAFSRGGLGEVIADGVTGFLVPPGDIAKAADAVREIAGLSRLACREHATDYLDLETSLDAHELLYRHVLASRTGAAGHG